MKVIIQKYNKGKNVDIIFFNRFLCSIEISDAQFDDEHPLREGELYAAFLGIQYLDEVHNDSNTVADMLTSFYIDMPTLSNYDCITNIIYFIINYCKELNCKYLILGSNNNIQSYVKESKDILKTMGFRMPRRKYDVIVYQY